MLISHLSAYSLSDNPALTIHCSAPLLHPIPPSIHHSSGTKDLTVHFPYHRSLAAVFHFA